MDVPFNPEKLRYAVVEYLKTSGHLQELVAAAPEDEGEYRLFCVLSNLDDAYQLVQALRAAAADTPFYYGVCAAQMSSGAFKQQRPGHPSS